MTRSLYGLIHRRNGPRLGLVQQRGRMKETWLSQRTPATSALVPADCGEKLQGRRVAVVGGGFAGLMAARTLCRHGAKVTVFEARAQLGGRVLSDTTFGNCRIVEAGAELIGSIHTYWCRLAIEYGLGLITRTDVEDFGGMQLSAKLTLDKPLSMDEIAALGEEMERRVLRPMAELAKSIRDPAQPWLDNALQQYDAMSVADYLVKLGIDPNSRLWKAVDMLLRNNNVAPLEQLNFLGLLCLVRGGQTGTIGEPLMGYWDELEIYRCAEGCQKLAHAIASDIQTRHKCRILKSSPVTHIDLSKDAKPRSKDCKPDDVKITYKDGKSGKSMLECFADVVFAVPPTVWGDVKITPVHPQEPNQVGLIGTGPAVKFFSALQNRFWIKESAAPAGGSLDLGQIWEATDNQMREQCGIVLAVFAGAGAPQTPQDFQSRLSKLYPGYAGALVKGKCPLFVDWPRQPFIKTGYCSPRLRQIFTVGKALNRPFLDRMFFAGEHTQMDHFGYMEGALRSGERAALQLMRRACGLPASPQPQAPVLVAQRESAAELQ